MDILVFSRSKNGIDFFKKIIEYICTLNCQEKSRTLRSTCKIKTLCSIFQKCSMTLMYLKSDLYYFNILLGTEFFKSHILLNKKIF